ncbi:SufD family Fe-S cluster assembly protein [Candidatus Uhrbacteria bacterium]|nr:SufD family Fe-S cluster assembly protein [Candidatus Uhrbacteria bacterium]
MSIPKLNFKYGLGVGFDPASVSSPFYSGSVPQVDLIGRPGVVERCVDLSGDRVLGKVTAELGGLFSGGDPVADWVRNGTGYGLAIRLTGNETDRTPIRVDLTLSPLTSVRVLVVADPGVRGTVIFRRHGVGPTVMLMEASLGQGSEINLVRVQDMEGGDDFVRLQAGLGGQSRLNLSECLFGGGYSSSWADVRLTGEKASFHSRVLLVGGRKERFDIRRVVRHLAPNSESSMNTTSVLTGSAKAIDRGLINVPFGVKGCSGTQKTDTLILERGAEFVSQPQLEVGEGDVQCRHAATVGHLDAESVFYLMSRGLTESQARRRLVEGFVSPMLAGMREVGMAEMVGCLVGERLDSERNAE